MGTTSLAYCGLVFGTACPYSFDDGPFMVDSHFCQYLIGRSSRFNMEQHSGDEDGFGRQEE